MVVAPFNADDMNALNGREAKRVRLFWGLHVAKQPMHSERGG
jgi:hypothetical protein